MRRREELLDVLRLRIQRFVAPVERRRLSDMSQLALDGDSLGVAQIDNLLRALDVLFHGIGRGIDHDGRVPRTERLGDHIPVATMIENERNGDVRLGRQLTHHGHGDLGARMALDHVLAIQNDHGRLLVVSRADEAAHGLEVKCAARKHRIMILNRIIENGF